MKTSRSLLVAVLLSLSTLGATGCSPPPGDEPLAIEGFEDGKADRSGVLHVYATAITLDPLSVDCGQDDRLQLSISCGANDDNAAGVYDSDGQIEVHAPRYEIKGNPTALELDLVRQSDTSFRPSDDPYIAQTIILRRPSAADPWTRLRCEMPEPYKSALSAHGQSNVVFLFGNHVVRNKPSASDPTEEIGWQPDLVGGWTNWVHPKDCGISGSSFGELAFVPVPYPLEVPSSTKFKAVVRASAVQQ